MFATVIDFKLKPGSRAEAIALTEKLVDEMSSKIEGLRGMISLDRGGDLGTAIALYESQAAWEAAAPVAQEVLGQLAPYFAEMPERTGCPVDFAKRYVTD